MKQENYNHHNHNNKGNNQKMIIVSSQEIANMVADREDKLIEPGSHNLLIYKDLKALREIYNQWAKAFLPQNEILLIAIQYDDIEEVKSTLRLASIDVEQYLNQGTLFIIDAQQGYQGV